MPPKYPIGTILKKRIHNRTCTVVEYRVGKPGKNDTYILEWDTGTKTGWTQSGMDAQLECVREVYKFDEELFTV
jgi:hypothetical protein